ncbi:MAG: elongation factor 1-beta [archaeon]
MGRNVLATFRVMPESVDIDLKGIASKIRELDIGDIKDIKEEPIAFGLKQLIVLVLIPDEGGLIEKIEEKLRAVEGVNDVENTGCTLI